MEPKSGLPRITGYADDAHILGDGDGVQFGFKLNDGSEVNFDVAGPALGAIIRELQILAGHMRELALAAGKQDALMAIINPNELDEVSHVSVAHASDGSHVALEITPKSGIPRRFRIPAGHAAKLAAGLTRRPGNR